MSMPFMRCTNANLLTKTANLRLALVPSKTLREILMGHSWYGGLGRRYGCWVFESGIRANVV